MATTHEDRLRELGDSGAPTEVDELSSAERAACLAGAEALRLLREQGAAAAAAIAARADVAAEMSDDARDAMSLPPRDRGRRIGVQVGRWFVGISREGAR